MGACWGGMADVCGAFFAQVLAARGGVPSFPVQVCCTKLVGVCFANVANWVLHHAAFLPSHARAATGALSCFSLPPWLAAAEGAPLIAPDPCTGEAAGVRTLTLAAAPVAAKAQAWCPGQVELPPQATERSARRWLGGQQVLVAPGERKTGQSVARLLSPELLVGQRELAQAQSQARLTASKLARDTQLHAEGIIPAQRLQDSRAQDEQAQLVVQERLASRAVHRGRWRLAAAGVAARHGSGHGAGGHAVPQRPDRRRCPWVRLARSGRLAIALQVTPEQARQPARRRRPGAGLPGARKAGGHRARRYWGANQAVPGACRLRQPGLLAPCSRSSRPPMLPAPGGNGAHTGPSVPVQAVVRQDGKAYVRQQCAGLRTPHRWCWTAPPVGWAAGHAAWCAPGLKVGDEVAVGWHCRPQGRLARPGPGRHGTVMLQRPIAFALAQRLLIAVLSLGLVGAGWLAMRDLPIDAFPDVSTPR